MANPTPPTGDPSKHHYIPEFYLRWWTGDDGRLERYTQPVPGKTAVRRVYPSEAGFERNLYNSPSEPERARNWIEMRLFQGVDNRAAPVLSKLNSTPVPMLSLDEMSAWSVFIRALHHRTPERLRVFREHGQAEWLEALDAAQSDYPRLKGDADPTTFEEYRARHTPGQVDRLILRVLRDILFSECVGVFLNDLHKRYFEIPNELPSLLCSDSPLAMTNGLQIAGGHYAIPLSPRRLLIAAHKAETIDQASALGVRELARNMNLWVVEYARRFIAAVDRSQDRFIRNRFGRLT